LTPSNRCDAEGVDGGEGGILTLPGPLESVTYRIHIAAIARNAAGAVAHCPPLPADTPLYQVDNTVQDPERWRRPIPYETGRHGTAPAMLLRSDSQATMVWRIARAAESRSRQAAKRADDCHQAIFRDPQARSELTECIAAHSGLGCLLDGEVYDSCARRGYSE
jgi:hypothetical protein